MTSRESGRLIVRAIPEDGESWQSCLRVAARLNNYASPRHLLKTLVLRDTKIRDGFQIVEIKFAKAWRLDFATVPFPPVESKPSHELPLFEKVCVCCLREGRIRLPSKWNQPLTIACDLHGTYLIDKCNKCGSRVDGLRAHSAQCVCGKDLRTMAVEECDDAAFDYAGPFLTRHEIEECRTFATPVMRAKSLAVRVRTMSCLMGLPGCSKSLEWPTVAEMRVCAGWMSEWPSKFTALASRFVGTGRTGTQRANNVERLGGNRELAFTAPFREVLREVVLPAFTTTQVDLKQCRSAAAAAAGFSLAGIELRLRFEQTRIGRALSAEEEKNYLARYQRAGRLMGKTEAIWRFGGSNLCWSVIAESDMLRADLPGHSIHQRSLSESAVVDLAARLRSCSVLLPRKAPTDTRDFCSFISAYADHGWASFDEKVEAIFTGEIKVYRRAGQAGLRLDDYEVDFDSFDAWRRREGWRPRAYHPRRVH